MPEKIKILHIIKSLGRGGAEMLLQETLKQHDQTKFEFHYIYFLPWKNQMVQGLRDAGGIVTNLPAKGNIGIVLKLGTILRYIRDNNIKLLHCHLPWAGFMGRFIYMIRSIPVIYTEHNKQERYHFVTKTINRLTFNKQTKAIAVSQDVAESIEKFIHPKIPVQTILNGVNMEHFVRNTEEGLRLRKEYNIEPGSILLGNIAVFRFQKRLKEWIDLFKIMQQKFPGIRGCIVGDGILKADILQYLEAQGMTDKIIFPGLQTNVLPWLSAIDIFVMTSEFEGLPVALLEAMSMQCAVVCTDAGGIKEVIRDNTDGFLRPVENWKELEAPLSALLENPGQLKAFGLQARKRVEESFSLTVMVRQLEEVYSAVCAVAENSAY